MSLVAGSLLFTHEMELRGRLLEKYPSPRIDISSDGNIVSLPTCRAIIWSTDAPPALTREPLYEPPVNHVACRPRGRCPGVSRYYAR